MAEVPCKGSVLGSKYLSLIFTALHHMSNKMVGDEMRVIDDNEKDRHPAPEKVK